MGPNGFRGCHSRQPLLAASNTHLLGCSVKKSARSTFNKAIISDEDCLCGMGDTMVEDKTTQHHAQQQSLKY
jgi:hypothetical protein